MEKEGGREEGREAGKERGRNGAREIHDDLCHIKRRAVWYVDVILNCEPVLEKRQLIRQS